jgi:hypothetical protein
VSERRFPPLAAALDRLRKAAPPPAEGQGGPGTAGRVRLRAERVAALAALRALLDAAPDDVDAYDRAADWLDRGDL